MKFPTYEEMCKNVAEKALDEILYNGKSIREWMQIIASKDAISRQAVLDLCESKDPDYKVIYFKEDVECLPPVNTQQKTRHCKDCKYFEYDSVANVDGIPIIVAHEFCSRWGDGCKTKEDGYCFLFEPQESEEQDADSN